MARKSKDRKVLDKAPKSLPDGVEMVPQEITLREVKGKDADGNDVVVREKSKISVELPMPARSGEGIHGYQKYLMETCGFKDANIPTADSLRVQIFQDATYVLNSQDKVTPENVSLLIPAFRTVRIADPAEAAGTKLTDWLRKNPGKTPDAAALAEIYGGIAK